MKHPRRCGPTLRRRNSKPPPYFSWNSTCTQGAPGEETMSALPATLQEARFGSTPIRNLNLAIEGTDLEDVLKEFERERERLELKMRSHYYLSTEWGVPFGTVSIAIPFYLAQRELRELHAEKVGDVEGASQ